MDFDRSRGDTNREKNDVLDFVYFSESIKNDTDKFSINSIKSQDSIIEQLTSQTEKFYNSNRKKFISQAVIDENCEYQHHKSFREIFKFSRKQSGKLENSLNKGSIPKLNNKFIQNGEERFIDLLNKHNMKSKKVMRDLDLDSSDDLQMIEEEGDENKINFNEKLAKRVQEHQENLRKRSNILHFMYLKAIQNQKAGQKMAEMNSLEKFNSKKLQRAKTSLWRKKNSASDTESSIYSSNIYMNRARSNVSEKIAEKTNFDVSRNIKTQNQSFRLSKNGLNSNIEVFRPPESTEKMGVLPKRAKTSFSVNRPHSFMVTCSTPISNSTLLNTSLSKGQSPKGLQNYEFLNVKPNLVSFNVQDLIKKSKLMEARCLSTFWTNYEKV